MASFDRVLDAAVMTAAAGAVIAASLVLTKEGGAGATEGVQVRAWHQYAEEGQRMGPAAPAVTIVEFGDYECAACKVSEKHFDAARRRNPDIAFVYRHYPLPNHEFAYGAAQAAECAAEQGMFWEMHAGLYRAESLEFDVLEQLAVEIGVPDIRVFGECAVDGRTGPRIELDRQAARQLGVPGTPTFLVNGRRFLGLRDSLALDEIIAEAREARER